ncbi:hypothetical protein BKA63DRAFT_123125 [Paraphoma chrysanthemicola]|nr:hypothetical protein BKA63DRAFT_123125 [Paraphoma chrysanthemicola]
MSGAAPTSAESQTTFSDLSEPFSTSVISTHTLFAQTSASASEAFLPNSTSDPRTSITTESATWFPTTPPSVSYMLDGFNGSCPPFIPDNYPPRSNIGRTPTSLCRDPNIDAEFGYYADRCLGAYCVFAVASAFQSYYALNSSKPITTTTRLIPVGVRGTGKLSSVVVSQWLSTRIATYAALPQNVVFPSEPCCGSCSLQASTVKLIFWPSHSATTGNHVTTRLISTPIATSSFVDENDFTWISPSVYIAFSAISATNRCGLVGSVIRSTTMAFDPSDISSVLPQYSTDTCTFTSTRVVAGVTQYSASELLTNLNAPITRPLSYSDVAQNCSAIEGYYYLPLVSELYDGFGWRGDPCHPIIAIPTKVQELQAAWRSCGPELRGGFFDPPITLGQGLHLVQTTTEHAAITQPPATPEQQLPQGPLSTPVPPPKHPEEQHTSDAPRPTPGSVPSSILGESALQPEKPFPLPGSTTTIIFDPQAPPVVPITSPTVSSPPVITLPPQPGQQTPTVITLLPTVITTSEQPTQGQDPAIITPGPASNAVTGVVVGGVTVSPGQAITIGGSTLTLANGASTVIGGIEISLDSQGSQAVIDRTSTFPLSALSPLDPAHAAITLGTQTLTLQPLANAAPGIIVGTHTLIPGSAIVLDGTTISLHSSLSTLFVNSAPIPVPAAKTMAPLTLALGISTFTLLGAFASGTAPVGLVIGTQTLIPGSILVISGTTLSLDPQQATVFVNGSPLPISSVVSTATIVPPKAPITLAGTTLFPDSLSRFTIGTHILSLGGAPVTFNSTTYIMTTNSVGRTVLLVGTAGASASPSAASQTTRSVPNLTLSEVIRAGGSAPADQTGPAPTSKSDASSSFESHCWRAAMGFILAWVWIL